MEFITPCMHACAYGCNRSVHGYTDDTFAPAQRLSQSREKEQDRFHLAHTWMTMIGFMRSI